MAEQQITIIAAVSDNGVIGRDGKIPWHIPADMKRFQRLTLGHAVVMGRRTWESIPEKHRPLKDRVNIVVSRSHFDDGDDRDRLEAAGRLFEIDGTHLSVWWVNCLSAALEVAKDAPRASGHAFICGGASLYEAALPLADVLELTLVSQKFEGDAYFPYLGENWGETWMQRPPWPWKRVSCEDAGTPLTQGDVPWHHFLRFERRR